MKQFVDASANADQDLTEELRPKIQGGTLERADIEKVSKLFGKVCNQTAEIAYEMRNMTQAFQFNINGDTYAVTFGNGACEVFSGAIPAPTVTFSISVRTTLDILTGGIHSSVAQMNGDIDYTGPRQDAIAFQRILELFLDEFI